MLRLLPICTLACIAACASTEPRADRSVPAKTAANTAAWCPQSAFRVPARAEQCATPGRVFSRDDIDRTGEPVLGKALQLLDPSITAHH